MRLKVDPSELVTVLHNGNLPARKFRVLQSELEAGKHDLNTYTRNGNLRVQRGCSRPIGSPNIVAVLA